MTAVADLLADPFAAFVGARRGVRVRDPQARARHALFTLRARDITATRNRLSSMLWDTDISRPRMQESLSLASVKLRHHEADPDLPYFLVTEWNSQGTTNCHATAADLLDRDANPDIEVARAACEGVASYTNPVDGRTRRIETAHRVDATAQLMLFLALRER